MLWGLLPAAQGRGGMTGAQLARPALAQVSRSTVSAGGFGAGCDPCPSARGNPVGEQARDASGARGWVKSTRRALSRETGAGRARAGTAPQAKITRRGCLLGRAAELAGAACAPALFHPSAVAERGSGVVTEAGARCADGRPRSSLSTARLALAFALVLAGAFSVEAQANCAPRPAVVESLATKYGETVQSIGLAANGQVGEVWANIDTGTWSFTVTLPSGVICLIASGTAFEHAPAAPAPMGTLE